MTWGRKEKTNWKWNGESVEEIKKCCAWDKDAEER